MGVYLTSSVYAQDTCRRIFVERIIHVAPGRNFPAPEIHPFIERALVEPLILEGNINSIRLGSGYRFRGSPIIYSVYNMRTSPNGIYLEMRSNSIFGARFFLAKQIEASRFEIREVDFEETPYRSRLKNFEPRRQAVSITKSEVEDLAILLSENQMQGGRNEGYLKGVAPFIKANKVALTLIAEEQQLTVQALAKINFLLTDGDFDANPLYRGILRGEEKTVRQGDQVYHIDLREIEVLGGSMFFAPASEVPVRLNAWIEAANRVDHQTRFRDLLQLYREFLLIHPFSDGNGRTSRLMLDYLSMRAGIGPIPQNLVSVREILSRPVAETELKLMKAFRDSRGIEKMH